MFAYLYFCICLLSLDTVSGASLISHSLKRLTGNRNGQGHADNYWLQTIRKHEAFSDKIRRYDCVELAGDHFGLGLT